MLTRHGFRTVLSDGAATDFFSAKNGPSVSTPSIMYFLVSFRPKDVCRERLPGFPQHVGCLLLPLWPYDMLELDLLKHFGVTLLPEHARSGGTTRAKEGLI